MLALLSKNTIIDRLTHTIERLRGDLWKRYLKSY
jgi:hypothetical protein